MYCIEHSCLGLEDLFVSLTIINYFYAKYPNKGYVA
jgi:hypothetical protein